MKMTKEEIKALTYKEHKHQTYDKVRYNDTDRQGHVNNAVFNTFFETGRVEFLYHPDHPMYGKGCSFVIASATVDYLLEIKWPGIVEIGTSITKVGRSSITIIQSLYQNGVVVGISENVLVQVDNETTKSTPLSEESKKRLISYTIFS
jgi:acyl-CoA thioester hydrolase